MIEITTSFSGTISVGEYENEKPMFALKETIDNGLDDTGIELRQEELYKICRSLFEKSERESIVKKIEKQRKDLRFYPPENYPSVTSVIGWDADFYVSPEDLIQYAARGSIIHKLAEIYSTTNKWEDAKNVPECYPDLVILKKGSLGLSYNDVDLPAFLKQYPIEFSQTETTVKNHEHRYAGRQDAKGIFDSKVTLIDYKSGSVDKTKCFKQLTAYWNCGGNEDVEQAMIIHLNNKTQQGYSKPIICDNKESPCRRPFG